jgi:phenylacetate-coenzyme A ligase PaaK-like adenylate-forming protein
MSLSELWPNVQRNCRNANFFQFFSPYFQGEEPGGEVFLLGLLTVKPAIHSIFSINSPAGFKQLALDVFKYQSAENEVYKRYINSLKINVNSITELEQIPFLPIEFFKTHKIISGIQYPTSTIQLFTSSGTTGSVQSKHYVNDVTVYETSYRKAFEYFYGNIEEYCILALLPSYLEREGSSLIYMADDLIKKSKHPKSAFYLNNYEELITVLKQLKDQKTILLGVTYALLDLVGKLPLEKGGRGDYLTIMETGGMKGKRKELLREELHTILCKGFAVDHIHSEYGMTELLSQAYSKGNGVFHCPPWMQVLIRDASDPFTFLPLHKTGGINVIDLANINSCSFIATQDLGKLLDNNSFEVLGRFDNSDIRGCNLLIE